MPTLWGGGIHLSSQRIFSFPMNMFETRAPQAKIVEILYIKNTLECAIF